MNNIDFIFGELLTDDEEEVINILEMPRAPRQFNEILRKVDKWSDKV